MTKGELLANEEFQQAPDDAEITVKIDDKDGWGKSANLSEILYYDRWIQFRGFDK